MSRRKRKMMVQPSQPNSQDADALHRVILAGQKIMYDPDTVPLFQKGMTQSGPLPDVLATEAAGLIKMLDEKSGGTIPRQVIPPAASALLLEMVEFMVQAKIAQPTADDVKQALQKLMQLILKVWQPQPTQPAPQAAQPMAPQPQAQPQPAGLMGA